MLTYADDWDQVAPLRYTYATSLSGAIAVQCLGGVTDQGTLTGVLDAQRVKLASTALPYEGVYVGFEIEITSSSSTIDSLNNVRNFVLTERKTIIGYSSDRIVTVRGGFGGGEQATLLALLGQKYKY